nr:HAMP domain-containing sensor histidine kinase [Ardenticatena sp.]
MHEQSESARVSSWFDLATVERWAVRLVRVPVIGDIGLIDGLLVISAVLTWALHDEFEFWLYLIYAWLGIGAFFWTWRTFAVRGIAWVLISFALMVQKISIGEMEPDAFIERPPLLLLLVSIFVLARWRDQNAAKLEATNRELAQRVADLVRLSTELESSQEKLREMAEARATFLAHFSHELRTPLSAMLGYLEYVLEDAFVNSESEVADVLRKTYDAGQHLLHLVNETLDLARIDAGKTEVHMTSFDLKREVQTVIETIRPLIARNGNTLTVEFSQTLPPIQSDPVKVRQILYNLLSNAAKFTQNGSIRLSVKIEPRSNTEWVYITVRDTGMGMSEEDLRLLFVPFTRANVARETRGTGLGMPLTQRLVQLLGGSIRVQSAPGQGTTFVVRLPRAYQEEG